MSIYPGPSPAVPALLFAALSLLLAFLPAYPAGAFEALEFPQSYFDRPIPDATQKQLSALNYHQIPIDLNNPQSKEALVKLKDYSIATDEFYARADKLNAPYYKCICADAVPARLRQTPAEKLKAINKKLADLDLELYVLDGYRSIECQKRLWDYFIELGKTSLGKDSSQKALTEFAGRYCSNPKNYDPDNWQTWPTHLTGGAVDLTLRRKSSGELLYMGGIFDDSSELSASNFFEKESSSICFSSQSAAQARRNRRLLYWLMEEAGFANYANEWWHFDFGTQMWVQNSSNLKNQKAIYGRVLSEKQPEN